MRGGLGKTLLLAFLLLTIFPLSLLAFLTYNEIQRDTRDKLLSSLATVVALKEAHVTDWIDAHEGQLALMAWGFDPATGLDGLFEAMEEGGSALTGVVLVDRVERQVFDQVGQVPAQARELAVLTAAPPAGEDSRRGRLAWVAAADGRPLPAVCYVGPRWALLGLLNPAALQQVVTAQEGPDSGIRISLASASSSSTAVTAEGEGSGVVVVSQDGTTRLGPGQGGSEAIGQALRGGRGTVAAGVGAYQDLAGQDVFGTYRWSAELGAGLVAEKRQVEVLAAGDEVTALLVAATLGAALLSAASAAVVTRRVTRPIVELTETAAWLARGDLNQQVEVRRKDEIGVLARAFNRMAAELRVLYGSLEAKVEERTQAWREANEALELANEYTRHYVMQLAISAEVARIAASILDLGVMLKTVVDLIGNAFELHYVAIYLVDETGEWAVWQVGTGGIAPARPRVAVGGPTLVGRAACPPSGFSQAGETKGEDSGAALAALGGEPFAVPALPEIDSAPALAASAADAITMAMPSGREPEGGKTPGKIAKRVRPDGGWELAIPLRTRGRVLGALVLESSWAGESADAVPSIPRPGYSGEAGGHGRGQAQAGPAGWVPESDWVVYQSLADQISIAIENARAYALERETVERLRELDRIQAEFLTNMSHALRTPLNSVIGFSRVMLKELDGPLSEMQRADLETIYEAGRQLLGLLNDMLDLSQLDMGVASWSPGEVDLNEVIEGVMATTAALARNKPIQLRSRVAGALPALYSDGQRVRQVILALLSNAVKFTEAGTVTLDAVPSTQAAPSTQAVPSTPRPVYSARPGDPGGVTIHVRIEGTGSESGLASVWDTGASLEQAGVSTGGNGQEAPTGFGLAVSKRVVQKLGGQIWLDRGDEGLVFTLTLPVRWEKEQGATHKEQVTSNT